MMASKPYTISALIDDLQAIYAEHGDIDVEDGRGAPLRGYHLDLVKHTETFEDAHGNERTETAHTLQIGRRY